MHVRRSLACLVLAVLGLAVVAGCPATAFAQAATPIASPAPAVACTTPPLDPDAIRRHVRAGLPVIYPVLAGTPPATAPYEPDLANSVPVDAETAAEISAILQQQFACQNAGRVASIAALFDEQGASYLLALNFGGFAQERNHPLTSAEVDPLLLDAYVESLQHPSPIPALFQFSIVEMDQPRRLENGLVHAPINVKVGSETTKLWPLSFLFRRENGAWRMTLGGEPGPNPTPAAATPAP